MEVESFLGNIVCVFPGVLHMHVYSIYYGTSQYKHLFGIFEIGEMMMMMLTHIEEM